MTDKEIDIHYPAKPDVTVTLKIQLEKTVKSIIGYLITIGQANLVAEYLPLENLAQDFSNKQCKVIVKSAAGSDKTVFTTRGIIERDELSPIKSRFGVQSRRLTVVFDKRVELWQIRPFVF